MGPRCSALNPAGNRPACSGSVVVADALAVDPLNALGMRRDDFVAKVARRSASRSGRESTAPGRWSPTRLPASGNSRCAVAARETARSPARQRSASPIASSAFIIRQASRNQKRRYVYGPGHDLVGRQQHQRVDGRVVQELHPLVGHSAVRRPRERIAGQVTLASKALALPSVASSLSSGTRTRNVRADRRRSGKTAAAVAMPTLQCTSRLIRLGRSIGR